MNKEERILALEELLDRRYTENNCISFNFRDTRRLERYGVKFLTGEACSLSLRKLFDLTEEGKNLLSEFFGGLIPTQENYNSGSKYSCFLTWEVYKEFSLFVYLKKIFEIDSTARVKLLQEDEFSPYPRILITLEEYQEDSIFDRADHKRIFSIYHAQPRRGFSNVSGFSGRSQ